MECLKNLRNSIGEQLLNGCYMPGPVLGPRIQNEQAIAPGREHLGSSRGNRTINNNRLRHML